MIVKLNEFPQQFLGSDIFATKIECDFTAYSGYDFAQFFKAVDDNDRTTAVISLIDSFMFISENNADTDELKEFITLLSPKGVLCSDSLAEKLDITGKNYYIMKRTKKGKGKEGFSEEIFASAVYGDISEFSEGELILPERDMFVSDFSFKQRRGLVLVISNGKSMAVAFGVGAKSVYIGAVATDKRYRNMRFGSKAVEALITALKDKKAYLFCQEKNIPFYEKLKFTVIGQATEFTMGD